MTQSQRAQRTQRKMKNNICCQRVIQKWIIRLELNLLLIAGMILFSTSLSANAGDKNLLYYVKFRIVIQNSIIKNSSLIMIPVTDEYRAENFEILKVNAEAALIPENPPDMNSDLNPETRAKHNAIAGILQAKGLKSVKSRSASMKTIQYDEIVMSYEGVIKSPIKIYNEKYLKSEQKYKADFEFYFSPIAYPDRWSALAFKHNTKEFFKNFGALF